MTTQEPYIINLGWTKQTHMAMGTRSPPMSIGSRHSTSSMNPVSRVWSSPGGSWAEAGVDESGGHGRQRRDTWSGATQSGTKCRRRRSGHGHGRATAESERKERATGVGREMGTKCEEDAGTANLLRETDPARSGRRRCVEGRGGCCWQGRTSGHRRRREAEASRVRREGWRWGRGQSAGRTRSDRW